MVSADPSGENWRIVQSGTELIIETTGEPFVGTIDTETGRFVVRQPREPNCPSSVLGRDEAVLIGELHEGGLRADLVAPDPLSECFDLLFSLIAVRQCDGGVLDSGDLGPYGIADLCRYFTCRSILGNPWPGCVADQEVAQCASGACRSCVGDCDGDGRVGVGDVVMGVSIALQTQSLERCVEFDMDQDDRVGILELIQGIDDSLNECELKD